MTKKTTKAAAKKTVTKTAAAKKEATVHQTVDADRGALLRMVKDAGLRVDQRSAWFKVEGSDKKLRMYVARKGPQIHFTFPVKGAESVSEAEAKKRHLGRVRAILHLDRQRTDVLKDIFRGAIKGLR